MIFLNSFFQLVEKGELSEASFVLGELLEKEPENEDFIAGYYAIRYWQNRETFVNQKSKIDFILKEWKHFEKRLKEKDYKYNAIIHSIKVYIIKKIANLIRNELEKEELSNIDVVLLNQIAVQLISINELEEAKEILYYSKRIRTDYSQTLFLLGDLYCIEAENTQENQLYSKGLTLIRDAYLLDTKSFPILDVHSKLIKEVIRELNFLYKEDEERIQFWLPCFLMIQSLRFHLRKLTVQEIFNIEEDIERLEKELPNVPNKFYEKTLARLIFFYLVIIHSLIYHYSDDNRLQVIIKTLEELSPNIFKDVAKIIFSES